MFVTVDNNLRVIARNEIPRLRFGTGSAIPLLSLRGAEGDEAIWVGA
ncbi:MAG: hypothetical protein MUO61_06930 [Dehalococcoidia bacterium]|nr:hypothetical protein [Dehalococcoidia bacterium]